MWMLTPVVFLLLAFLSMHMDAWNPRLAALKGLWRRGGRGNIHLTLQDRKNTDTRASSRFAGAKIPKQFRFAVFQGCHSPDVPLSFHLPSSWGRKGGGILRDWNPVLFSWMSRSGNTARTIDWPQALLSLSRHRVLWRRWLVELCSFS